MAQQHVRVGVAALIVDDEGRLLMGIRKGNAHGVGKWQFPGGHLEMGETHFQCAVRETLEETGLRVQALKTVAITEDIFSETKHYNTIFVVCHRLDTQQEPQAMEPDKCSGWSWKSWKEVRELAAGRNDALFLPIINLLLKYADVEALTDM